MFCSKQLASNSILSWMNTFPIRISECFRIQIHDALLTNEFSKVGFHVLRYRRLELPFGLPASDSYNPAAAVKLP